MKVRSNVDSKLEYDREGDVVLGEQCEQNSQLRPHIVFFGDELDESLVNEAIKAAVTCSVFVIVGTSLQVSPANSLPYYVPPASQMVVIVTHWLTKWILMMSVLFIICLKRQLLECKNYLRF